MLFESIPSTGNHPTTVMKKETSELEELKDYFIDLLFSKRYNSSEI